MPNEERIIQFHDKFLAKIGDEIVLFESKAQAETAVVMDERSAEINARAAAYCKSRGLKDKNAVAKTRIICDFLAFEMVPEEEEGDEE